MSTALARFRTVYGSHPLHLLVLIAGFAVLGAVIATVGSKALWNPNAWYQSIAVWFAAAIVFHDLVLFPVYALADRMLVGVTGTPSKPTSGLRPPVLNYLRVPALGSALTLLVFLPGIIQQGKPDYLAATGQTQEPFLGRWLMLIAVFFGVSAIAYAVRLVATRRQTRELAEDCSRCCSPACSPSVRRAREIIYPMRKQRLARNVKRCRQASPTALRNSVQRRSITWSAGMDLPWCCCMAFRRRGGRGDR